MFECTMGINSCRSAFVKPSLLMTYAHPRRGKACEYPMVSASTLFHRSIFRPAECAAARSRSRPHPPLLQAAAPCCGMHAMVANSASTDRAAGHGARLWGREARTFICLKMVDLPLSPAPSRSIFTGCARSKRGVRYRADGKMLSTPSEGHGSSQEQSSSGARVHSADEEASPAHPLAWLTREAQPAAHQVRLTACCALLDHARKADLAIMKGGWAVCILPFHPPRPVP